MNKQKFFKLCATSETCENTGRTAGDDGRLQILVDRNILGSSLERGVVLCGVWAGGSITQTQLYVPTPGRQGDDCYQNANAACERAMEKFQRWLDEWLVANDKSSKAVRS